MAYMVVYQQADGSPSVESCADLDAAIAAAERLRNARAIERPRIFETTEIHYDFQPYYRIQVVGGADEAVAVADSTIEADPPPPAPQATPTHASSVQAASAADELVDSDMTDSSDLRTDGLFTDFQPAGSDTDVEIETDSDYVSPEVVASAPEPETMAGVATGEFSGVTVADTPEVVIPDGPETIEIYDAEYEMDPITDTAGITSDLGVDAGAATDAAAESIPPAPAKTGLFEKFVSSLEGGESRTSAVADDAVEDIGESANARRGLFGR